MKLRHMHTSSVRIKQDLDFSSPCVLYILIWLPAVTQEIHKLTLTTLQI